MLGWLELSCLAVTRHLEDRFRLLCELITISQFLCLCRYLMLKCWLVISCVWLLFSFCPFLCIPTSSPPCPQPAGPEYARWSPCDIQQTQSTSQHSLSSSTHSNHQTHGQALLHPRRLHLPGKTPRGRWHWLALVAFSTQSAICSKLRQTNVDKCNSLINVMWTLAQNERIWVWWRNVFTTDTMTHWNLILSTHLSKENLCNVWYVSSYYIPS